MEFSPRIYDTSLSLWIPYERSAANGGWRESLVANQAPPSCLSATPIETFLISLASLSHAHGIRVEGA